MGAFEDFVRAELPNRQVLLIGSGNPATANSGAGTVAAIGAYWLDQNDSYKRYVRYGLGNTDWEVVPTASDIGSGGGSGTITLPQSAVWETTYTVVSSTSAQWDLGYTAWTTITANSGVWSSGGTATVTLPQSADWDTAYSAVTANSAAWSTVNISESANWDTAYSMVTANSGAWSTVNISESADWNTAYSAVTANSAAWDTAYSAVTANSGAWSAAGQSLSLPQSSSWNTAYSSVTANSAAWDTAYSAVTANSAAWSTVNISESADWNTAYSAVTANSGAWSTVNISESADWNTAYSAVTANSGAWSTVNISESADWNTAYSSVTANSAAWDTAYSSVTSNSAAWNLGDTSYSLITANSSTWSAAGQALSLPQSASWDTAYSSVTANSGNWDTAYSSVTANSGAWNLGDTSYSLITANSAAWSTVNISESASWDTAYSAVTANSAAWSTVNISESASWDAAYSAVTANSGVWDLADTSYSLITANSASWNLGDTSYSLITANSGAWSAAGQALSLPQSASWDTAYSAVTANSGAWSTVNISESATWDTAYSTVTANSAAWSTVNISESADWNAAYSSVTANSATWDTAYSTVTANSASWSTVNISESATWNTAYSSVTANSGNWNTAYSSVTANSADWNTAYSAVTANSATWSTVNISESANWDTAYSSVTANSASWNLGDTSYSLITANSASWNLGDTSYSLITANSGNWDTAYSSVTANSGDWSTAYTTVSVNSGDWNLASTAYSLITANSATWGSAQGDGSSGSGSVIAPFAYASMPTPTSSSSGTGTNLTWVWTYIANTTATFDITFDTQQADANYTVVTDAQGDDAKRGLVYSKTVSGFKIDLRDSSGIQDTDTLGLTVLVYASNPLIGVATGGSGGGTVDTDLRTTVSTNSANWNLGATSWTTITANSASWLGGAGSGAGAAGAFITEITCGTNSTRTGGITTLVRDSDEVAVDGKTPVLTATVDTPTVRIWTQWEGSATEWTGSPTISSYAVSDNPRTNISNGNSRRFEGYYDLDLTSYRGSTVTIPLVYSGLTKYVDVNVAGLGPEIVDFVIESSPSYGQDHYKDGDDVTFLVVFDTTDVSSVTFGGGDSYAIGSASNVSTSMTATSARFTRTIDTTLTTKTARPFNITAKNALGTEGVSFTSSDTVSVVSGPIITNVSVGAYPGSQTELKFGDDVPITLEFDTTNVDQVTFGGSATTGLNRTISSLTSLSATVTVEITNSSIANNSGGTETAFLASARKVGHHSNTGPQINSSSNFSKTLTINNQGATFTGFGVTYPSTQQAIKSGESATVALTISNVNANKYSVSWTNNNTNQLNITDPTVDAATKQVTYASGGYNISSNNIRCEVTRSENDKTTSFSGVVKIANDSPIISVYSNSNSNTQGKSIQSGGTNGTQAQTGNIRMVSNQLLLQAPTLQAPNGGTLNTFSYAANSTVFNATMTVSDTDPKGTFQFGTLNAVNLAGKVVSTISTANNSSNSYKLGGFVERTLTMSPKFTRTVALGTDVFNTSKIVVSENSYRNSALTFSTLADGSQMDATRGSSGVDGEKQFTIVDSSDLDLVDYGGDTFFYVDKTAVNNNTTGGMTITIREDAT